MAWSTLEQLKALKALNPARVAALREASLAMSEKYAGQHVAYTDDWNGDKLVRVIVIATSDADEYYRLLATLEPDIRRRVQLTRFSEPSLIEIGSAFFE